MSKIVTVPSDILRQVAKPVTSLDTRVQKILQDMENALKAAKKPQGVGLAAPQIGVSLRVFMIRPQPRGKITVFINPEIIKYSQRRQSPTSKKGVYEGCLSLPGHYAPVTRSASITITYQTPKLLSTSNYELITKTAVFSDFPAHVIQHEMDHLNGILFIDRVLEQNSKLFRVSGDSWEEVTL